MPKSARPRKRHLPRLPLSRRPRLYQAEVVFRPIEAFLSELAHGTVSTVRGVACLRTTEGEWQPVVPLLNVWIAMWGRIANTLGAELDQAPLTRILKRLDAGAVLSPADVAAARAVVARQRAIYTAGDARVIREIARSVEIRVRLEDAGVVEEERCRPT